VKPLALVVVLVLSSLVGLGVRKYFGGAAATPAPVVVVPVTKPEEKSHERPKPDTSITNPVFPENLEIRGVAKKGKRIIVQLSDGSRLTERDVELIQVEKNSAVLCRSHPPKQAALCKFCRKYAVKPGVIVPKPATEKSGVAVAKDTPSKPAPVPHSGASNVLSEYRGEAVVPVNGELQTAFTIGRK